ncbi:MAG: GNAT family N-acetyltransferase [Lachnospiraceae bacterium]
MNIRKICPREYKQTREIFSRVFECPDILDNQKMQLDYTDKHYEDSRKTHFWTERIAAFDEEEHMMGFLANIPFEIYFDKHILKMGGIADVACLPEHRNKGVIANCFRLLLETLYKEGYAMSYLYPFSDKFYRKYGYENCLQYRKYDIDFRCLKKIDVDGVVVFVSEKESLAKIVQEVKSKRKKYNLNYIPMPVDDILYVEGIECKNTYDYAYKNHEGVYKGYLRFHREAKTMVVDQFVFSDEEGVRGLLYIIQACATTYLKLHLEVPECFHIDSYLEECNCYDYISQVHFRGMLRIINVKKVLESAEYMGSGNVSIRVSDTFIEENNHTFSVSFEGGSCINIEVIETDADIELTIQQFSMLIIGRYDLYDIARLSYIDKDKLDIIRQVFYKKPLLITEYF